MRKYLLALAGLFVFCTMSAEKKTAVFTVNPPLVCNNCETKVKDNIRFEKGVKSVKPSAKKGLVEICYDDAQTNVPNLIEGLKKIGYDATLQNGDCPVQEECVPVCPVTNETECCGTPAEGPCCE